MEVRPPFSPNVAMRTRQDTSDPHSLRAPHWAFGKYNRSVMTILRNHSRWLIFLSILLSACASSPPSSALPAAATPEASGAPTPVATAAGRTQSPLLTLWVTPAFAPDESPAGSLFADHLSQFEESHPGLAIVVRVKNSQGPGGLLETLTAAHTAAPDTLPDLILVNTPVLRSAADRGLLLPLNEAYADVLRDDSYEFARQAEPLDGARFGLPLASDVDVFAYRIDRYEAPPRRWEDILAADLGVLIPVGDATGAVVLTQYLNLGGELRSPDGQLILQQEPLTEVLAFFSAMNEAGLLPESALSMTNSTQSWDAFRLDAASGAIAPLPTFMREHMPDRSAAIPLPTRDGDGAALAHNWYLAAVAREGAPNPLAGDLLAWLSDSAFLGTWTQALGLLPAYPNVLATWPDGPDAALANSLVTVTQSEPAPGTVAVLGPILQQALNSVLLGEETPASAALRAVAQLEGR